MREDDGSVHTLEAVLLSLILLGAAHYVATMREDRVDHDRPRANLERTAKDAMAILSGLEDANGSLLDAYLVEALHCAKDPSAATAACEGGRSRNLSLKVQYYLPPGAGYAVALDNGVETRDLHRSLLPPGETVSATFPYVPSWNLTFLMPELSCYEPGMSANLTALPLRRGGLATVTSLSLKGADERAVNAIASHLPGAWNATLDALARPASGVVRVDAQSRGGVFTGGATLATCDLGGLGDALVEALRDATFAPDRTSAPLGSRVTFSTDLSPLLSLPGVTLVASNVTIYEPLPPRTTHADAYVPAKVLPRAPTVSTVSWDVPADSLYGAHPAVLRAQLRTDQGALVEVRRVEVVQVALPDGTVPIDPPYRAVLQVWFADWR